MIEQRNSFKKNNRVRKEIVTLFKFWLAVRNSWRAFRIHRLSTKLLGCQFKRSRNKIEIDITYLCNLKCNNCNRSVSRAPEALHIDLDVIHKFVDDSVNRKKYWSRIRILGGEPTLHPYFHELILILKQYHSFYPSCVIEVVSNGFGAKVKSQRTKLPKDIWIENSNKTGNVQEHFGAFNLAPIDDPKYNNTNFKNGCTIMEECGMGLTPLGYYPCAVAGGIDRVLRANQGYPEIPDDNDDMEKILENCCKLCGRFHDGYFLPINLRPKLKEHLESKSWTYLYELWNKQSALATSKTHQ